MKTFLSLLGYSSLEDLTRAGVAYEETVFSSIPGVMIDGSALPNVLSTLQMEVEQSTRQGNTDVLILRRPDQPKLSELSVSFPEGKPRDVEDWVSAVGSFLLPLVRQNVEVHMMRHRMFDALPEVSPDCLRIWVDAGGPSSVGRLLPCPIFDAYYLYDKFGFSSSLEGLAVVDEESQVELAEVFDPSNIFILLPLGFSSTRSAEHASLFKIILSKLAPFFRHGKSELSSKIQLAAASQQALTAEGLVDLVSVQVNATCRDLRGKLATQMETVARLRNELAEAVRRLGALQIEEASLLDQTRDRVIELATMTVQAIGRMPMVRSCSQSGSRLVLRTERIYCFDHERNNLHDIGDFLVQIFLNASRSYDLWSARNLTHLGPLDHHGPHVGTSCNPCLGNTDYAFRQRAAAKDVLGIVSLIIQFLQSVNFADHEVWGPMVRDWPMVPENRWRKVEQVPEDRIPAWQLPDSCIRFLRDQGEAWWEGGEQ